MTDYDSRRTGNGLLDTGSTPVWSTLKISRKQKDFPVKSIVCGCLML